MQINIHSVEKAIPHNKFTQEEIYNLLGYRDKKIERIFQNSGVTTRYLFIPRKGFHFNESIEQLNQRRLEGAVFLGKNVLFASLSNSTLQPEQIGLICFVTSTCFLHPHIPFLLLSEINSIESTQLLNILGMSCTGALTAIRRSSEFLHVNKEMYSIVLSIELCSAAYNVDDTYEMAVGNAIGSDGAAACVLTNKTDIKSPSIISYETLISAQHKDLVGFYLVNNRLRAKLSKKIVDLVGPLMRKTISQLLNKNDLSHDDIKFWLFHPGGRKIIESIQTSLQLSNDDMKYSRLVLNNYGNISSATILFVLAEFLNNEEPVTGDYGVLAAVGPGMTVESCLLRW